MIYAGSLTHDRGITTLVEAAQKLGMRLVLCGRFGNEAYGASICASTQVEYQGQLDSDMLHALNRGAVVGMCTLRKVGQYAIMDTFPTKIYEYMMCGVPTIMTDTEYNKALNAKYHFGICVDPENTDEIAAAVRYLVTHQGEAHQMGENGKRAVEREFNWGAEEQKLLSLYRMLT